MTSPTAGNLRVPLELEGAGRDMSGYAQALDDYLKALRGKLEPLKEHWQGPAKEYYHELQEEWDAAANGLLGPDGVCGEIASALNLAWNNYTDCEWANVQGWKTPATAH
jgi:uncharacterized protein YukE